MKPKDYIIKMMGEMAVNLDNALFTYAYEEMSRFHIIEVSRRPDNTRGEAYYELEARIWREFYELFPNEDLLISEPDSMHDMSNLIHLVDASG
jgi:hypothetical protein